MTIHNRNGKSVDEELIVPKKRGRPKKTEVEGPKIYPASFQQEHFMKCFHIC